MLAADVADPDDVTRVLTTIRTRTCRRWPASCTPRVSSRIHLAARHGRCRSGPRVRGKGLGCLASERSCSGHAAGLLPAAPRRSPRCGGPGARSSTPRPMRSSTGWPGGCASGASRRPASTSASGRQAWVIGRPGKQLELLGIRTMSPADALAGMAELIAASAPHGMVARIDWPRFLPFQQLQRKRPLLAQIERELPETAAVPTSSGRHH